MPSVCLKTLSVQFDELLHRLDHSKQSVKLKASINVLIDWKSPYIYEREIIRKYLDIESPSERSLLNGLYIVAIASFEEFLKQSLIYAMSLRRSRNFSDYDNRLIKRNICNTSRFILENEDESDYSKIYEACKKLGTCVPGSENIDINEDVIALLTRISDLEKFFECLSDIGFKTSWVMFGQDSNLKRHLNTSGSRETEKVLKGILKIIRQNRNSIAHTGLTSSNISESLFYDHIEILRCVAKVIDSKIA